MRKSLAGHPAFASPSSPEQKAHKLAAFPGDDCLEADDQIVTRVAMFVTMKGNDLRGPVTMVAMVTVDRHRFSHRPLDQSGAGRHEPDGIRPRLQPCAGSA